jgi:hypothetical protein
MIASTIQPRGAGTVLGGWVELTVSARGAAGARAAPQQLCSQKGVPIMESSEVPRRVLVVAHKTAATVPLLDAVRERAAGGPCAFTLLVPNAAHGLHRVVDAEDQGPGEAQQVLDEALPRLSEAAGSPVAGVVGDPDPVAAVHDAINLRGFDEIIISTLPTRVSRWLKLDLPSKVSGMGLPVTTVTPADDHSA